MLTPLRHTPLLPGTLQNLFYPPRENEYTYFQRAAELPFQEGDPPENPHGQPTPPSSPTPATANANDRRRT